MTPLLLCAYKPRYLRVVLKWFRDQGIQDRFRIFAWDNGGAADILREAGLEWHCTRDDTTGEPVNVGKALAMRMLVDIVAEEMPQAESYVCIDDDIIVGRDQLELMTAVARRPGMGMIAARFHPFNLSMPAGGTVVPIDPCLQCGGANTPARIACSMCSGSRKNPLGTRMRVYPAEDRTVRKTGRVAGGIFAVSKSSLAKLPWAPHLYPIRTSPEDGKPVVYWTEDASLDAALTEAGLLNGYLQNADLLPAIHLPDLNVEYMKWKTAAVSKAPTSSFPGEI